MLDIVCRMLVVGNGQSENSVELILEQPNHTLGWKMNHQNLPPTVNKRKAMRSFARLGEANLRTLIENIDLQMDDQNVLHFRLVLDDLIDQRVVLASDFGAATVKGQAKFEVYSGQPADEQRLATLNEALILAKESGDA